jgi:hypothetical protein
VNRDGGGKGIDGTAARPIPTVFGPAMKCAAGCGRPVDQNQPHVRVGVVYQFKEGKMVQADVYHIRCWDPTLPEYDPDAPVGGPDQLSMGL